MFLLPFFLKFLLPFCRLAIRKRLLSLFPLSSTRRREGRALASHWWRSKRRPWLLDAHG